MPCEAQNSYALWIVVNSFRIWYDIIKPIHRYRLGRIDTAHFKRKFKLCDLQLCPELIEAHSGFKQFDFSAFDCSGIFRFQTLSSSGADFLQTANAIEIRNQFVKTDRQVLRLGGLPDWRQSPQTSRGFCLFFLIGCIKNGIIRQQVKEQLQW